MLSLQIESPSLNTALAVPEAGPFIDDGARILLP